MSRAAQCKLRIGYDARSVAAAGEKLTRLALTNLETRRRDGFREKQAVEVIQKRPMSTNIGAKMPGGRLSDANSLVLGLVLAEITHYP